MKQSVTIQEGWISIADSLSDVQRGQFYHAICHYALDGVIPDLPELLAAIFDLIRPAIDLSVKRKAAQRKGARIRRKNAAVLQNGSQTDLQNGSQTDLQNGLQNVETCETVSNISTQPTTETPQITPENTDLQTDLQTGLQNEVKEKQESLQESLQPVKEKKKSSPPIPPLKETKETVSQDAYPYAQMLPEPDREKWIQWEKHRRQIRKKITPKSAEQQIKLLLQCNPTTAGEIIDNSIRNGYQGLFPPKYQPQQPNRKDNSGI